MAEFVQYYPMSGNPTVDWFWMLSNAWLNVLNWLGVHEPVGAAVEITVISIILGVFLYIILDKLVFAKMFESMGGGETKATWPSLIVAICIVILNIYSGTIMLMLPLFYIILFALPLIGGYIFFVRAKGIIAPFRAESANIDKELNQARTLRLENAGELREIKQAEQLDKSAAKAVDELLALENQIMAGNLKFEKLLKSIQTALNRMGAYIKSGAANPEVLPSLQRYLASVAGQLSIEDSWLNKVNVIEKGVTRTIDAEKLRVDALLKGITLKLELIEKTSYAQLKELGLDAAYTSRLEQLEATNLTLTEASFGIGTTFKTAVASDTAQQAQFKKAALAEAQKLQAVLNVLRTAESELIALKGQFDGIETKLKVYETAEEEGRQNIVNNAAQLAQVLHQLSTRPENTTYLNEARALVATILQKEPIEIKRDVDTEKLAKALRDNIIKQEGVLYKLEKELGALNVLEAELEKIDGITKANMPKWIKDFAELKKMQGISKTARGRGALRGAKKKFWK